MSGLYFARLHNIAQLRIGDDTEAQDQEEEDELNEELCAKCIDILHRLEFEDSATFSGFPNYVLHHETVEELLASAEAGCLLCVQFCRSPSLDKMVLMIESPRCSYAQGCGRVYASRSGPGIEWDLSLEHVIAISGGGHVSYTFKVHIHLPFLNGFDISPPATLPHNSKDALPLVKQWMQYCSTEHQTCIDSRSPFKPSRLVFVDTEKPCVKLSRDIDGFPDYATLSHCWGQRAFDVLTATNITAFQAAIPQSAISKTFADAFWSARELGISYIWIDSLCIMQDDDADWSAQASLMSSIYTNSKINICATAAEDGSMGLFYERQWVANCHIRFHSSEKEAPLVCECTPSQLYTSIIKDTPLSTRGWVVQERILPCRSVHFASKEVLWECHQSVASESFPNGYPPSPLPSAEPLFFQKQPLQRKMWDWILEQYTESSLTYSTDRLIAISGIARRIHDQTNVQYLAGLWRDTLETDLLWRRHPIAAGARIVPYRAPSWSWGSYDGRILSSISKSPGQSERKFCIKILDAKTVPPDTFGEITGGVIRISCYRLIRGSFNASYHVVFKHSRHVCRGEVDARGDIQEPAVYMLPITIAPFPRSDGCVLAGLLLQPSRQTRGQYVRVGTFNYQAADRIIVRKDFEDPAGWAGDSAYMHVFLDENGEEHRVVELV